KDFSKNVKNSWKKYFAGKKKGEMAVTLLFLGVGLAVGFGTAGAGLPVLALLGISAGKHMAKKGFMKGVKAANSELNTKALKGKDTDDNTILKLNATQARESSQAMARHFVSSFKNFERMSKLREQFKKSGNKWANCREAAGYL